MILRASYKKEEGRNQNISIRLRKWIESKQE